MPREAERERAAAHERPPACRQLAAVRAQLGEPPSLRRVVAAPRTEEIAPARRGEQRAALRPTCGERAVEHVDCRAALGALERGA